MKGRGKGAGGETDRTTNQSSQSGSGQSGGDKTAADARPVTSATGAAASPPRVPTTPPVVPEPPKAKAATADATNAAPVDKGPADRGPADKGPTAAAPGTAKAPPSPASAPAGKSAAPTPAKAAEPALAKRAETPAPTAVKPTAAPDRPAAKKEVEAAPAKAAPPPAAAATSAPSSSPSATAPSMTSRPAAIPPTPASPTPVMPPAAAATPPVPAPATGTAKPVVPPTVAPPTVTKPTVAAATAPATTPASTPPAPAAPPAASAPAAAKPSLPAAPAPTPPAAPAPVAAKPSLPAAPAPTSPAPAAAKPAPRPPLAPDVLAADGLIAALLSADLRDTFGFLGMHEVAPGRLVVRAFLPGARSVKVVDARTGAVVGELARWRDEGFFVGEMVGRDSWFAYRLRVAADAGEIDIDDPYRFSLLLSDADVQLLAEGSHLQSYRSLGAHPKVMDGVAGVAFTVWAPHAARVSVIGDFNDWDGRRHGMRLRHDCGVWEIFLPGIKAGNLYKYEIKNSAGTRLTDKCDPYAFFVEKLPGSAAIIHDLGGYRWGDEAWMTARAKQQPRESPISIYEVHLASWRRKPEEGHRWLSYRELADDLVGYVKDMGFTHVQLMPIGEFDFDASLGYQPFVPFAPTSRWGSPDEFRLLVDRLHRAGIGVILDWVPNHFSDDPHGLREFDGTHLFEHGDPGQRRHPGSNTLVYDYGRREVASYLVSNALFWCEQYHIDGLRVGGLASMLYLDYGRSRGEWTPNRMGGHENLEAIDFLRRFNEEVYGRFPGTFTIAEDNSGWQRVSHPTFVGGLGFGFKWNQGWVRDSLRYLSRNPVHRKYYHDEIVRGPNTAYDENFILPLSHDEVGYGRGSLLRRFPGDRWQRFATLRLYYAFLFTHPGKKLLFMGDEFAQEREWNSEISLDWHLLEDPLHRGTQTLIRDLNKLYRDSPTLYQLDCEPAGFEWIDRNDADQSIVSFIRRGRDEGTFSVVICNFTPVIRRDFRVGVPAAGFYVEKLNTDAGVYGGGNVGNAGGAVAEPHPMHGRPNSLIVTIPPFAAVILEYKGIAIA